MKAVTNIHKTEPQSVRAYLEIMTTYRQREYDMVRSGHLRSVVILSFQVINELREEEEKSRNKKDADKKELKVTRVMANHPNMLSEKELHDITVVFRSLGRLVEVIACISIKNILESGVEEGTIVSAVGISVKTTNIKCDLRIWPRP